MSLRKAFFVICLIISALCLAAGYWIPGQWLGGMSVILIGPAWLLARKFPDSALPLVCLLGSIGFAVAGRLIGSPPLLMMFAAAMALAAWDLLYLDSALGNHSSAEQTRHYENKHLQSLAPGSGSRTAGDIAWRLLEDPDPFPCNDALYYFSSICPGPRLGLYQKYRETVSCLAPVERIGTDATMRQRCML